MGLQCKIFIKFYGLCSDYFCNSEILFERNVPIVNLLTMPKTYDEHACVQIMFSIMGAG